MHLFVRSISIVLALGGVAVNLAHAKAATFPDHPVHLIVGYAPGGGIDSVARRIGAKLAAKWGQPVIIDNRPGADGVLASELVASAAPDGYTIGTMIDTLTILPLLQKVNYDPIKSFAPITLVETHPAVLVVNPSYVPVKSLQGFIASARAKPGQLNFGSNGTASADYLGMVLLMQETGITLANVTYRGDSPIEVALLGGEIQAALGSIASMKPQIDAGKLIALAVTSKQRSPSVPDVPTVAEAANLPDFEAVTWEGILAPAGTPPAIVEKLNHDIVEALRSPDVAQAMAAQGYSTVADTPQQFEMFLNEDVARWTEVLKTMNAKK